MKNCELFGTLGLAIFSMGAVPPLMQAAEPAPGDKQALPVREIIMYSSGVALFERAGELEGETTIDLRFKTEDINDLLKSMVVQGGAVSSVTYDSRDPITKTLRSFGVDLTENPGMGQLLNQMRGERVSVHWPNQVTGTMVGIEKREEPGAGKDERPVQAEYLTLLGEDGLQSIPLKQVQKIQLESKEVQSELKEALQVLAGAHDTQKKAVTITLQGDDDRNVRVTYISEAPVWKTSYRLVLDEEEPFLQGWAIVENTSDEDWENVRLSLVSGRPISFVMDLYQPLYAPRPTVQPELYLSLRPQTYGESLEEKQVAMDAVAATPAARYEFRRESLAKSIAPAQRPASAAAGRNLSYYAQEGATTVGTRLEMAGLQEGAAEGSVAGELFEYGIRTPVTIPRQKSAMLPIVGENVSGEKLSIYNQSVQAKHPLNGYRLKNDTDLHLMQGPITVFDGGSYAGDARMEDIPPGGERLISYALDLNVEVEPQSQAQASELVEAWIKQGSLYLRKQLLEEKTYNIRNRDTKEKTVLIEHPFRSDWDLESPKADERTREVYRFKEDVAPGKTEKLTVREKRTLTEQMYLSNLNSETFAYYTRSPKVSPAIKEAFRKVQDFQRQLSEVTQQKARNEERIKEISQEQSRIRENMSRLQQNSELYTRYVTKFDQQETELENIRNEMEDLKDREMALQRDLNNYLSTLDVK